MSKFKPGAYKTKEGIDVVIFEVSDRIYAKIKDGNGEFPWNAETWNLEGIYTWDDDHHPSLYDLVLVLED